MRASTRSALAARAFLRASGAWQALPPERIAPIEAMRVEGDDGGGAQFSRLRPRRTRARVDRRGARAARGARSAASRAPASTASCAARRSRRLAGRLTAATLRSRRRRQRSRRAAHRRRRRRALVGARRGRHRRARRKPYGQTAVVANFACERAHHGSRVPMVPRRRRCPRVAAAARAARFDRLVGAGAPWRRNCSRSTRPALADARGRGGRAARSAHSTASRRARVSAVVPEAADGRRASARARRRRRARRPSARRARRQPRLRRRAGARRGAAPSAGRSADAGAPVLLERYARRRAEPVLRDADGHRRPGPAVRRRGTRGSGRCATLGCPPSSGCRPASAPAGAIRAAIADCYNPGEPNTWRT